MRRIAFTVTPDEHGERLDRLIARRLRSDGLEVSNRRAKQLVDDGVVRVDARPVWKASDTALNGSVIDVELPADIEGTPPSLADLRDAIVFEDPFILAINKPAGLPTHATHDPDRDHAHEAVARLLRERGVESPYVGIHHRLDAETSGVLVFAIDRSANKGLADAFSQREAAKTYEALCLGRRDDSVGAHWVVENHLGRDRTSSTAKSVAVTSGGDPALTSFELRAVNAEVAWIRAHPRTGRMHQIRAHLAGEGRPILGDTLYGGPTLVEGVQVPRVMLHAAKLEIPHPTTGGPLVLRAPIPADFRELASRLGVSAV